MAGHRLQVRVDEERILGGLCLEPSASPAPSHRLIRAPGIDGAGGRRRPTQIMRAAGLGQSPCMRGMAGWRLPARRPGHLLSMPKAAWASLKGPPAGPCLGRSKTPLIAPFALCPCRRPLSVSWRWRSAPPPPRAATATTATGGLPRPAASTVTCWCAGPSRPLLPLLLLPPRLRRRLLPPGHLLPCPASLSPAAGRQKGGVAGGGGPTHHAGPLNDVFHTRLPPRSPCLAELLLRRPQAAVVVLLW